MDSSFQTGYEQGVLSERARLSRDIHDILIQDLATLRYFLRSSTSVALPSTEIDGVLAADRIAERLLADARCFVRALAPPRLDDLGLEGFLRFLAESQWQRFGLTVKIQVETMLKLNPTDQITAVRIVQSLMANVVQHARAHHATIRINVGADDVIVRVDDDGVGINPSTEERAIWSGRCFGLRSTRERVAEIGGTFHLASDADGTTAQATYHRIPYDADARSASTTSVLIADDHALVRAGVRHTLETSGDPFSVLEAASPEEAHRVAQDLRPDVALVDLDFGAEGGRFAGIELTRTLRRLPQPPRIVILSGHSTPADRSRTEEAGAVGFVLKGANPSEVVTATRAAMAGEPFFIPTMHADPGTPAPRITAREVEVLALLGEGRTNRAIAQRLCISEATVKSHIAHIMERVGAPTRGAAARFAREYGLIE
ncbi:response regulator transcription factor family protein [Curtobacterium sp. MCLR17_054]|uniref:helix-turn-helix transcriptional regulator n=1 Tax=Curtobacterium sp. MCLR17_054 TaxID=2175632 RepID=UPI0015E8B177|nr:response regulator transcription factor family protein [Curtobacterium sp. MCLR17_054]WIE70336.1 response regulator [Curtobacterium sp. MCLR17_054]